MNPLFAAALDVERFCVSRGWRFCFIGALAVIRWGEPRLTRDIDLTILTGFGGEERFIDALLEGFAPRRQDARQFAIRHRVVLLAAGQVPVDIALGAMPFEERIVRRATPWTLSDGASILTCGAEDSIVLKTFAARDQDWLDIEGIVRRQRSRLDTALIAEELGPLLDLKGTLEDLERLQRLLAE